MTHSIALPKTFNVDTEHSALRVTIMVVFVAGWVIGYVILNALIPNQGLNIIALLASFIFTAVTTQQIERALKKRWPSGRRLEVDANQIQLIDKTHVQQKIDVEKQVNVLTWRFSIRRRARVPKGWYMVACALEQDDVYLPVYTFMSPEEFDGLKTSQFPVLLSLKESAKNGQADLRLMGEQRRLHAAEDARWMNGAEMSSADFVHYIRQIQEQFPQWMPSVL